MDSHRISDPTVDDVVATSRGSRALTPVAQAGIDVTRRANRATAMSRVASSVRLRSEVAAALFPVTSARKTARGDRRRDDALRKAAIVASATEAVLRARRRALFDQ